MMTRWWGVFGSFESLAPIPYPDALPILGPESLVGHYTFFSFAG